MRRNLRLLALILPLLLAACVPHKTVRMKGDASLLGAQLAREKALAGADHWVLQGRLGVSNGKDGGSGSFSWTQNGENYERSEEHTSELQSLMRISYAVFCLKKKKNKKSK